VALHLVITGFCIPTGETSDLFVANNPFWKFENSFRANDM
jgi:hypothetical protein